MTDYDFKILQPNEFECISRDLIQARDGVYIESFTAGKDDGIDFRYALSKDKTSVIQAKRYSSFSSLISGLKKETKKIQNLKVSRYYISTSVGLTPANKTEIQNLFGSDILSTADIIGRDDLNNLLGLYPEIEKKYYKLWLSSTNVLESIMHKRIENWAAFELDIIKNDIHQYVINDSFDDALRILSEHRYVIISGIPGIGKTTLARMLVYELLARGMEEFIYIPSDIDDAVEMFEESRKQVFFYDDFLGSTVFEVGEKKFDQRLLSFIEKIQRSENKLFILTTREYILSDALLYYDRFQQNHIEIAKCTLALNYYTKRIKASILYNHLADAHIPDDYVETLLVNGNYKKLINHQNFNPRVIETFINDKVWVSVEPKNFMNKLLGFFDSPMSVWEKAFEKLEYTTRYMLLTLASLPLPVRVEDWRRAFDNFRLVHMAKLGLQCDEFKWKDAIRVLEDCFVVTDRLDEGLVVKFYNPSVRDFLSAYLGKYLETCQLLIKGAYYTEQLYSMFSDWKWFNHQLYSGASYVIIDPERLGIVKDAFLRLKQTKRTCTLEYSNRLINKVTPFDDFVFLKHILRYFPQMCRNNPGLVEQFVTEEMLINDKYEISDRLKLLRDIRLEYCSGIDLNAVLKDVSNKLEHIEDYVSFIDAAADFEMLNEFDNDKFKDRMMANFFRDIEDAENKSDIDNIEDNIKQISNVLLDWGLDFEDDLEYQRDNFADCEPEYDDWERNSSAYTLMDEDSAIQEMFTSLRNSIE